MSPGLIALRAATALGIVLVALALWQMREAAQLLAVAVAVSAGLAPAVAALGARGVPRRRAAAIVFGGGLLALLVLGAGVSFLLALDLALAVELLPLWYDSARAALVQNGGDLGGLAEALPRSAALTEALVGAEADVGGLLLAGGLRAVGLAAVTLGAAALGFFWLLDEQRITRLWLSLLPVGARTRVRALGAAVYSEVGIYVRGVAGTVLLTTLALMLVYRLGGVPGASALAVFGGVAQVVPLLGPALAVLPVGLLALALGSPAATAGLAVAIIAVAAVRLVVAPRLLRSGISVNPVLVVVMIMALAELGGLPLILLAPPLAAALQAATRALVSAERSEAGRSKASHLAQLEERLAGVAAAAEDSPEPMRVQALVERARALLADARRAV